MRILSSCIIFPVLHFMWRELCHIMKDLLYIHITLYITDTWEFCLRGYHTNIPCFPCFFLVSVNIPFLLLVWASMLSWQYPCCFSLFHFCIHISTCTQCPAGILSFYTQLPFLACKCIHAMLDIKTLTFLNYETNHCFQQYKEWKLHKSPLYLTSGDQFTQDLRPLHMNGWIL